MKTTLAAIAFSLSLLLGTHRTNAATVTLYNSNEGNTPDKQPELTLINTNRNSPLSGPNASINYTPSSGSNNGYTTIDSTLDNGIYVGYSNHTYSILPSPSIGAEKDLNGPQLDRTTGFSISFSAQLLSELHSNNNRAGFDVIALSNDTTDHLGIELDFQLGNIFAQGDGSTPNPGGQNKGLFLAAENASYDTGSATNYTLSIQNNTYQLLANNNLILSGPLRDYSAFTDIINPYKTPNFLFFGDDSSSAQAKTNLGSISVATNTAAVPYEFSPTWGILALAVWGTVAHRKNKKP